MEQDTNLTVRAAALPASPRVADPTVGFRRRAGALALPIAFLVQGASLTAYAIVAGNSGMATGAQDLELYGAHPDALRAVIVLAMTGSLLAVPGILAAMRVLRPSRPRLSLIAGILMIGGYVSYFGIAMTGFDTLALAATRTDAAAALDATQGEPGAVGFFLLFVAGNLIGTSVLAVAVLLTRSLPKIAGVLILAWPVSHVIGLSVGSEWFEAVGCGLEVVGFCLLAARAMRMANSEWAAQG